MLRTFFFSTCCIFFLCDCTNDSAHQNSSNGNVTDSTAAGKSTQGNFDGVVLNLDTLQFSVTTPNQREDPKVGLPSFDIYLHIAGFDDSIFIARDYSATFVDKDMIRDYSILVPDSAMFVVNSFYAGAGYYYYGLKETGILNIYRIFMEEGSPETEGKNLPAHKPELLKTVRVYTNKIETTMGKSGG